MTNKRVMIIDDDVKLVEELEDMLSESGYELLAVTDPVNALDRARRSKPDVIVLDLKMPNKTGFQLADEIRHNPDLAAVPIIAMTGFYKDDYSTLIKMCGINTCIKKPFNPLNLIAEIESVIK